MRLKKTDVQNYLEAFKKMKVLIIGDVMVDSYLVGKVNRISPEAPIPIVSVTEREYRLGGAANVALNIRALGAEAILCSVIGEDEKGKIFKDLLTAKNLRNEGIIVSNLRKTTVKTRVISGGQHLLRVDDEHSHFVGKEFSNILLQKFVEIIKTQKIDAIIFEDYDKGVLSEELIVKIVKIANEKNIPTCVDPKKNNFYFYKNVSLFKPNFKEFTEGTKSDIDKNKLDILQEHASEFLNNQGIEILMITLSELGVFIANGVENLHLPAEIRDISDVSGAGDTVISLAALLLAAGASLKEIANLSNIAGGLVCEKTGVVPIDPKEFLEEF
ncbi:MAG: PfkB family carbohydrate kinase [Bacteroidales bacterium]|nr:PfkB family carbohydrate kinase [Bacteroidales bacterium]